MNTLTDLTQRIEASLDSIRPYLEADGGNVKIQHITDDHIVKLEFEAIKKSVPEVRGIEVVNLTTF